MNIMTPNILKAVFGIACIAISTATAKESYSPYANQDYPKNVYWGDTHLHTNLSIDAYLNKTTLGPTEAYKLARGETITADNGMKVRLQRPLDFLVIADHAFYLGVFSKFVNNDPILFDTPVGKKAYARFQKMTSNAKSAEDNKISRIWNTIWGTKELANDPVYLQSVWNEVTDIADAYNNPDHFTTFIGYEWTSERHQAQSFWRHRVIVFKDSSTKASQVRPFTQYDSLNPEDLWKWMKAYERKTGGEILAIPHNANLSRGEMFAENDVNGQPLTVAYATTRSRWEPLYEITQMKGDSETHPLLSPNDQFANFERWNSWGAKMDQKLGLDKHWSKWPKEEKTLKKYEYARSALLLGLKQQSKLGINPFKFGMIGSSDAHTALSTVAENNFWGKFVSSQPNPKRVTDKWNFQEASLESFSAAGYAAVWATENTRESLFAAMKRKEVYATTGPRMRVRLFAGWDFDINDAYSPDLAKIGYNGGIPMGGDLTRAPNGKAPKFLIRAVKDPLGANLDRVQVIKGWRTKDGALHEKIYNVALSDGRIDQGPKTKKVGSTVDLKDASYTNIIGDPELATVWTDPDFDPNELAFYYVRVLEIPTPRWTAYDAKFFDIPHKDIADDVPMTTQERAYTSPIWYSPSEKMEKSR